MGGKSKQSQRTKNNARPSSSSRSAELLNSSTGLDGGLLTLGNGKPLPPLFPTLAAANLEQGLNPEFQMCIKKLNKKDPITRTKALQELCELINNGDVEDVVAALPSWAHFYKILTADTDRKVREMTQVCHGAVVRACGRRAAPQLKALLPAWLQAQYDDHAPAQAQAHLSLTRTFPDNKLPEVISFCKAEVIAHLLDNLNGNTEALIKKRIENAEERELQMNRIVTSSLQGLQYFVQHLPAAHDAWLWAELTPLLQNAFWKLPNSTPHVRAAWLGALGALAARWGGALGVYRGAAWLGALGALAARWGGALGVYRGAAWLGALGALAARWGGALGVYRGAAWLGALGALAARWGGALGVYRGAAWLGALGALAARWGGALGVYRGAAWLGALGALAARWGGALGVYRGAAWLGALGALAARWGGALGVYRGAAWLGALGALAARWGGALGVYRGAAWLGALGALAARWGGALGVYRGAAWLGALGALAARWGGALGVYRGAAWLGALGALAARWGGALGVYRGAAWLGALGALAARWGGALGVYRGAAWLGALGALAARWGGALGESHGRRALRLLLGDTRTPAPLWGCLLQFMQHVPDWHTYLDKRELLVKRILDLLENGGWGDAKQLSNILLPLLAYLPEDILTKDFYEAFFNAMFTGLETKNVLSSKSERQAWITSLAECLRYVSIQPREFVPELATATHRAWLRAALGPQAAQLGRPCAGHMAALLKYWLKLSQHDTTEKYDHLVRNFWQNVTSTILAQMDKCGTDHDEIVKLVDGHIVFLQSLKTSFSQEPKKQQSIKFDGDAQPAADRALLAALAAQAGAGSVLALYERVLRGWLASDATRCPALVDIVFLSLQYMTDQEQDAVFDSFQHRGDRRLAADAWCEVRSSMDKLDIAKIENIVSPCPHLFKRCDDTGAPDDVTEIADFTKLVFDMEDPETQAVEYHALRYECVTSQLNCLFDDDNDVIAAVIRDSGKCDVPELSEAQLLRYVNTQLFRAVYLRSLLLHHAADDDQSAHRAWCYALTQHDYLLEQFCMLYYNYVVIDSLHEGYAFWRHYDVVQAARSKLQTLVAQANTKRCSDEQAAYDTAYLVMLRSWYVAYGGEGADALLRDVTAARRAADLDVIVDAYYRQNHTMLYDRDISECGWSQVVSNVAVVEFLCHTVTSRGWDAPPHHWDFVTITLCSLLNSLRKSMDSWGSTKVAMLARAALRLWVRVRRFVRDVPAASQRRQPAPHVAALPREWADMFAPDTHHNMFALALHLLESCNEGEMTSTRIEVIGALIECIKLSDWFALPATHRQGELCLPRLAGAAAAALQQPPHHACAYLAYYLLLALAEPLVLDDVEKLALWSDGSSEPEEDAERPQLCVERLLAGWARLHDVVDAALGAVELGEGTCEMVPMSDSYNAALAWLLLGAALLALAARARGDLAQQYAARLVRQYVAPHAVRQQLHELQRRAHEIEDAEIHIAWSAGEVTCAYSVEERRVELRVALAREHPLVAPRLAAPGAGPGANTHWLALYLAYQNGTLLNALKMWTSAVNARVESAPQCYICYCRLHPASGRLPRVPCHQCRNKFHNVCLRKWFATSNKSSCPLCRSPF
uniref:E3 ubiquitin-protein ligase listerin n=1 Tax=Heliothis virescens TaxID=7102 RepID=A0A2A4K9H9_HELVI